LSGVARGAEVNVDTNLSYTPGTRELASSTGTNVTLPEVSAGGNSGLISGTDKASYQETLYWIPYHTPKPPL